MDRSCSTLAASMVLALSVAGCSSSDDGGSNATMTVTPSLGLVRNAEARLLDLQGIEIVGARAEIGLLGSAVLQYPANWMSPMIVEVLGDDDAEYFDEATQSFLPFDASQRMRTYLPAPQARVGVTTLTELAAAILAARPNLSDVDILTANQAIRDALAPSLTDITLPPMPVDEISDLYNAPVGDPGAYAAILAALAEMGYGQQAPALSIMAQLREDLADEVLDGMRYGEPLALMSYDPATFSTDFSQALSMFTMGSPLSGGDFGTISTDMRGRMGRMFGVR